MYNVVMRNYISMATTSYPLCRILVLDPVWQGKFILFLILNNPCIWTRTYMPGIGIRMSTLHGIRNSQAPTTIVKHFIQLWLFVM